MNDPIGPTRLAFKRCFGIEACHVRDRNETCHGIGRGKFHRVDVVRIDGIDQIRARENPDQVGDGVSRDARETLVEHGTELVQGAPGNLDIGSRTFCVRDLAG